MRRTSSIHGLLVLVAAAVTSAYDVQFEDVTVGGYICGESQNARVYYPESSAGPVPLLSFAHGYNCPGKDAYLYYSDLHTGLTAAGYVVIVSESSYYPLECLKEWKDQKRSMEWAKTSNLSDKIDFSKTGIFGHSMGGGATYHLASLQDAVQDLNIRAAVALHPQISSPIHAQPQTNSLVPIFFGSGSEDAIVKPDSVKKAYNGTSGVAKVFSEIKGAVHDEPMNAPWGQRRHMPYVIAMFDCHLKGIKDQCAKVYAAGNEGDALCGSSIEHVVCEHANEPLFEGMARNTVMV